MWLVTPKGSRVVQASTSGAIGIVSPWSLSAIPASQVE